MIYLQLWYFPFQPGTTEKSVLTKNKVSIRHSFTDTSYFILFYCLITARKRSLRQGNIFKKRVSRILSTGGGGRPGRYPSRPGTTPLDQAGTPPPRPNKYTPQTRQVPTPPRTRYIPPTMQVPPQTRQVYLPPPSSACWEIRATRGRYASYWNAFLYLIFLLSM